MCDCCDGSDEKSGCNDRCAILGELTRKDLQSKLNKFETGAKARALLVPEAAKKLKEWSAVVHDLTPKAAALKAQVDTLAGTASPFTILFNGGMVSCNHASFPLVPLQKVQRGSVILSTVCGRRFDSVKLQGYLPHSCLGSFN